MHGNVPGSRTVRKARAVIERPPAVTGWLTSDEDEIERRRWRGRTEIASVEPLAARDPFFGAYRVRSYSGGVYEVEIRSLDGRENTCGCRDHAVNGLGTCKHVEGALYALRRGRARAFDRAAQEGCPWPELYLSRSDTPAVRLYLPPAHRSEAALGAALDGLVSADGRLLGDPLDTLPAVERALSRLPAAGREARVSRFVAPWLEEERRRRARDDERARLLAEAGRDEAVLEALRLPLLPYQREGMLHLAFGERALLADEMGLGKTVQAIAAADLLRRRRGIERVLVVAPASLKGEWQEQIARFTDLPSRIVEGPRAARLGIYREPAFFHLANYEQVVVDGADINRLLRPDLVILDEAQRIKNWQTKTAAAVKALDSRYAFVLTGTPLENRIDEVYSIAQFLDPALFGPLFRFNRSFYQLDERGRPVGYSNLDEMHRRLRPVMLRRRKADVEGQLPGRTTRTHLVPMHPEQRVRYEEYEKRVARLVALSHQRPLTRKEFDFLQQWLACMRMLCDTPYILDPDCRVCPKLEELESVLGDLLAEPATKVIVFSEWTRMLELVGELAREMDVDVAWHTGSVPQQRRREEIRRFKEDPFCRLFLSSDSGSVGLNLQAANVVVNLDQPWNPARLEQRIARAWRKHQTRPVQVVNLVTEESIEHGMLGVLARKQELADGVLDGRGDLAALDMPSGRGALIERLEAVMGSGPEEGPVLAVPASPLERLQSDLLSRFGDDLLLVEARRRDEAPELVLAVVDDGKADDARRLADLYGGEDEPTLQIEVMDRTAYATMQRLAAAGVIAFAAAPARRLHEGAAFAAPPAAA